jgi:5-methyltetrahydrofolate--homocysteine methyltransferase
MDQLKNFIIEGNEEKAVEKVKQLLEDGMSPELILNDAMIAALDKVGDLFQEGVIYLPEMLIAARAMQAGMEILKPRLVEKGVKPKGKVVIGTVKGDLHDIGKDLVVMAVENAGFEVINLGTDISPDKFVEAIKTHNPFVVGLSALLTTTMDAMRHTITAIEKAGLRQQVKIMVGGAVVSQKFSDEIGADYYGADSTDARNFVQESLGSPRKKYTDYERKVQVIESE